MDRFQSFLLGLVIGTVAMTAVAVSFPSPPVYIYDDEARLVGFCNGKYLIRTEEDEFPESGCIFIEPITWKET